jgi:MFS family permease
MVNIMFGKGSKALVGVMALGTFVVVLDNTIMNVSISALVKDLDTTVSGVQTAIALNALMMAAFVLMGGKLADIIGMKRTFFMGALIYVAGSLLASFSDTLAIFILGWCAIQGFGAAMMLPNVNTIIRANVKGRERVQAYGTMAGINALGTAVGPLIGGFLTTFFSWRWAFRLEVFILLFVLLSRSVVPKDKLAKVRPQLDKIGVAWQAAAMIFLVLGTLAISDYGLLISKQPLVIGSLTFAPFGLSVVPFLWAAGLFCLSRFVKWESDGAARNRSTLVDTTLFRISDFVHGLGVRFLHVGLIAGTTFAVPLYLQVTFGLSAFETGFILLALTAGMLTTALGATRKGMQYLPRQKVGWGFLVALFGLVVLIVTMMIIKSAWWLLPGLFIYGLGLGLIASQIVNLIMSSINPKQTAEASGITSTLETLGSSVGTAVVGTVLVVALTSGVGRLVTNSTVFTNNEKTQISNNLSKSIEVVSTDAVSENIKQSGAEKNEAIRIYDQARKNAFIITLLFMALVAAASYGLARKLPATKTQLS